MFKLFHGTTMNAYKEILEGGYDYYSGPQPWDGTSDHGCIYFFAPYRMIEVGEVDEDDGEREADDRSLCYANQQAQITNACLEHPWDRTVVIEFELHDEPENYESLGPDISCKEIDYTGAVQMEVKEFNEKILPNAHVRVHFLNFHVKLSLLYIAGLIASNNTFTGITTEKEDIFARALMKADDVLDLIPDYLYEADELKDEMLELSPFRFFNSPGLNETESTLNLA